VVGVDVRAVTAFRGLLRDAGFVREEGRGVGTKYFVVGEVDRG
jgi:hypothetical protein